MSESPTITVEVRTVYGVPKVYPACERSKLFARVAGTTTLTRAALEAIQALGYEIVSTANADWRRAA